MSGMHARSREVATTKTQEACSGICVKPTRLTAGWALWEWQSAPFSPPRGLAPLWVPDLATGDQLISSPTPESETCFLLHEATTGTPCRP